MEEGKIWVASFDIGKKNFSFYIEEMDRNKLLNITNISQDCRYNKDGTITSEFEKILDQVYLNGKTILHMNSDLTKNCDSKSYLDPEIYHNMIDHLDSFSSYWNKCSAFVIEQQMSFGKKNNTMALKLGQHCYSYFTFNYGRFKEIIEYPAYHKTKVLGAPKKVINKKTGKLVKMSKPQRKSWAVEKAIEILNKREEQYVLDNIKNKSKKDDLADTLIQLQSWKYMVFVNKSC